MKRKRDRSESGQLRNKINRWVRFLSKERDWDYVFMLEMEYMKLRQMEEYFKEMDTFVGIEYVRRDLRICLRLLDIVMERDDLDIKRSPLKFVPFKGDNGRKMYKLEHSTRLKLLQKVCSIFVQTVMAIKHLLQISRIMSLRKWEKKNSSVRMLRRTTLYSTTTTISTLHLW